MRQACCFILAMAASWTLGNAPTASATPLTLTLTSGSNTVTVVDGTGSDLNGVAGAVTWLGSIANWNVNVTTGLGSPLLGSPGWPQIDLNSVNVSQGAGTLTILLTQGNFAVPPPGLLFSIGGTTNGSVEAFACAGVSLGDCEMISLGPFGPPAYSGYVSFPFPAVEGPFEIGLKIVLTHTQAGVSSFDAELQAVPEPGTFALIGAGLFGLGLALRIRRASGQRCSPISN